MLVIIPTKDRADLLRQCLSSIFSTCRAEDIDIVVIDHDSQAPELAELLTSMAACIRVMPFSGPFNYSRMNNLAVSAFARDHRFVLFLNNDIEALDAGWLEEVACFSRSGRRRRRGADLDLPRQPHTGMLAFSSGLAVTPSMR